MYFVISRFCLFLNLILYFISRTDESSLSIVWAHALKIGLKTVMKYGQAQKGDRTIVSKTKCKDVYRTILLILIIKKWKNR